MELILWRHAEAIDGFPDQGRPLTKKGLKQAELMASFLTPQLPSDTRILVSPALRAQQTARALTKKFTTEPAINVHATPQAVINAVGWPLATRTTLLVGHQPWIGEVAALLLSGKPDSWNVKKGAIWWFSQRTKEGGHLTSLRLVISPDYL